jgi:release factor glutamine methyltransferase
VSSVAPPPPTSVARARGATLAEAVGRVSVILASAGVPTPDVDARWLVAHAAGSDPHVWGDRPLPSEASAALTALVSRRARREPLQRVLGETAFRALTLVCAPGVFVPRPETEVVAGVAIEAAHAAGRAPLVGEPCTGSGAIACSLAAEVRGARVVAGDVDARAVAAARTNARRLREGAAGVDGPAPGATVEVRHGDLLDVLPGEVRGHLDVLVANPPYLPAAERGTWEPEVAVHDPDRALVGGPDGHEVVAALTAAAPTWLAPEGTLILEIDERRGDEACALARGAGLVEAHIVRDLTGAPRALVARRAP